MDLGADVVPRFPGDEDLAILVGVLAVLATTLAEPGQAGAREVPATPPVHRGMLRSLPKLPHGHPMAPDPQTPADLQRLGRYRIIRPLSKGGMALVYEGRRESLAGVSPRVAIKLILPEHAGSEAFKELFINEARLGASMHHQNLVQIQDFDSEDDRFFLVMEYVEGPTLRRCIAMCERYGLKIPMGVVAEMGRQACDGLHYAHEAVDEKGEHLGLIHRDIKPSNLILNPHGVVKVLDFGISQGKLREERKGSVKGTWGYMAPEQATGRGVAPGSDVFGLAVVLYELASLRPMFVDKGKDEIKRLLADDHAARMAATLDPEYGPLVRVLIRALQRDPKARYTTASEFGRALSALLPDPITARDEVTRFYEKIAALEEGRAKSGPAPGTSPGSQGSMLPDASAAAEARRDDATSPWLVALGGVILLTAVGLGVVGVVGAGAMLAQQQPDPVRAPAGPDLEQVIGEPGGPAADEEVGGRRPPGRTTTPPPAPPVVGAAEPAEPEPEPTVIVPVIRPGDEPPPPPQPEITTRTVVAEPQARTLRPQPTMAALGTDADEPDAENGLLLVDAKQEAEIYVSGQFVSVAPLKRKLPPGRYAVSIVSVDGRRRTFEVEVEAGAKVRRVWDFERNAWR